MTAVHKYATVSPDAVITSSFGRSLAMQTLCLHKARRVYAWCSLTTSVGLEECQFGIARHDLPQWRGRSIRGDFFGAARHASRRRDEHGAGAAAGGGSDDGRLRRRGRATQRASRLVWTEASRTVW